MSSKVNAACKTVATRNNKNTLENCKQATPEPHPEGVVFFDNCNTLIEVTVKTKGRKRTSTMVSSSSTSQKTVEEKRKPITSGESYQHWGRALREQNRPAVKQSLQQLTRTQPSKSIKHGNELKEVKKHTSGHQKNEYSHKHLDEIPVKQPSSQKRMEEHAKGTPCTPHPSSTSIASSMESILVLDRAVQCGGIFDYPDDKFGVFNPVRTLGFLMKELEHLVKDDKASQILTDMEQILFRIPAEPGKPTSVQNLEAIALQKKLEASTVQLEETSKKMNTVCETLREERDSLQRQVHKQVLLLNEARERQLNLEATVKTLKQELEEAIKTAQTREKTITELKEGIKGYEFSQKVISDLRTSLNEQTEIARQRHLEVQYLTLEKDKLSVLSSYKDSLLVELRTAVKELQNHIAEQLTSLKDVHIREESSNPQISLVHGGLACSSPTSTSSRESNAPTSWQDISDVSLSAVEHNSCDKDMQKCVHRTKKIPSASNACENSERKRAKNINESKNKDTVHLEFISLPGGESSNTLLFPSYKDLGCMDTNSMATKGKEDTLLVNNKKNDSAHQLKNNENKSSSEFSRQPAEKMTGKDVHMKNSARGKKSSEGSRKQTFQRIPGTEKVSTVPKNSLSHTLIGSSITEHFQNIFHDIRAQSRIPVNVPSPPRNYPHPDWSDSTLPSISAVSELNAVPSNDTLNCWNYNY